VIAGVVILIVIGFSGKKRDRMIIQAQQEELNRMRWNK
jgi:hypothetical protein